MATFEKVEILMVEDSPADAELTLHVLRKHHLGNSVFWVKDGAEALDFAFCTGQYAGRRMGNGPRLILLDIKLPKVDGIEVLGKIKADDRTRTIPVVMLTSSQEGRDIRECYELGVNSYIVKPVEFDKFVETVTNVGLYWVVMNKTPE